MDNGVMTLDDRMDKLRVAYIAPNEPEAREQTVRQYTLPAIVQSINDGDLVA